jgi:Tfp pilus assembly protein PilF
VEFKPHFLLISNFEAIGRPPRARSTFPATLEVTRFRPKKEQLFLSGRPESVPMGERQRLLGIFRKVPPPEEGYAALAAVNRRASERDRAVGPACFTSHATVLGEEGGTVHGWPPHRDYLPAFVDIHGMVLPRFKRELDDEGRPKPIQLTGISGARFKPSAEYFRVALEEKPDDPSILSDYGNWLKDRGELDEAEAAYRKAIASDDGFANAHGNLASVLDDRGDIDSAEREYRRAVELDAQSTIHAENLAFFLWRRRQDRETGERLLREAMGRQRDAFTVGRLALFTDLALGDKEQARRLYDEALDIAPGDPWTHGRLAEFLQREGDLDAAREHFEGATAGELRTMMASCGTRNCKFVRERLNRPSSCCDAR